MTVRYDGRPDRVHAAWLHKKGQEVAPACGAPSDQLWSNTPTEINCKDCLRVLAETRKVRHG